MKIQSLWIIIALTTLIIGIGCVPPPLVNDVITTTNEKSKIDSVLLEKCEMYLSSGYEYYKQKKYKKARDKYLKVIDYDCGEEFHKKFVESLYYNIGSCYQKLNNLDSALYYYQHGLEYSPENLVLLENIAFIFGRQQNEENQITTRLKISEVKPDGIVNLWKLLDLLKKKEEFEQVLGVLERILILSPNDSRAQIELETAYNATGRDPINIIRGQWEVDRKNIYKGQKYADLLINRDDHSGALVIYEELIQYDSKNITTLEKLSKIYNDSENYEKALETFKTLNILQPRNLGIMEKIVSIHSRQSQFKRAIFWGNKAINSDPQNGIGYEIRGKIYQQVADNCSGQREGDKTFDDKLVYQISLEDLKKSRELGNARVISMIDYVKNFVPNEEDLFMVEEKSEYKPEGQCYQWISRTVRRSTLQ